MIKYIIPIIIILCVVIAVVFFFRNKHRNEIRQLDEKKNALQNEPVLEEVSKVKGLNMNGQTEEMFERWRNKWTEMMDVEMPKIDDLIFKAEEHVDKFQFAKATEVEQQIAQKIVTHEEEIDTILKELHELMDSEEKNREDITQLKDKHRAARKTILAHQYSFGEALKPLEERLEQFNPKFEEYAEHTSSGNYLKAREIVEYLNVEGDEIFELIAEIPSLLTEIQHKIPNDLQNLRNGYKEMEQQSYFLVHLEIPERLNEMQEDLKQYKKQVSMLEITSVKGQIEKIQAEVDMFYDALEGEVVARNYVDKNFVQIGEKLTAIMTLLTATKAEAEVVQKSYHLREDEMKIVKSCEDGLKKIQQQYNLLAIEVREEKSAFSSIKEELDQVQATMSEFEQQLDTFTKSMKNLRVDENTVHDRLTELNQQLHKVERKLHKANIPGIPDQVEARIVEAKGYLHIVQASLANAPLNMEVVYRELEGATKSVEDVEVLIEDLIENAALTELIIQYGNRYRASNAKLNEDLNEAERQFRNLRYTQSLAIAAEAIQLVEPGALKKIQTLANDTLTRS